MPGKYFDDMFQLEKPDIKQCIHEEIDRLFWRFMRSQTNITDHLEPGNIVDLTKPEVEVWRDNAFLLNDPFNVRYLGCIEKLEPRRKMTKLPPEEEWEEWKEPYRIFKFLNSDMVVVFEYDERKFQHE